MKSVFSISVVGHPLVSVAQDLVGLGDLLESLLRVVGLVLVGVELQGHLPVGLLDVVAAGLAVDPQDAVIVLAHRDDFLASVFSSWAHVCRSGK